MAVRLAIGSALALLVYLLTAVAAAGPRGPDLSTDRDRYLEGQPVRLTLRNPSNEQLRFASPWRIREIRSGDVVARLFFRRGDRTLGPGERRVWRWDQIRGAFRHAVAPTASARLVDPGGFTALAKTSAGRLLDRFQIGQYFTLGFRHLEEAEFTLFATDPKPIGQMEAQAKLPRPVRDLRVSGVVQEAGRYNPGWSYTMGPGSIMLGKTFIELCDASPDYVEEHLDSWIGQRWCPWSSYVKRAGR
jgi:hypothetical protein